jgi:UDP-N-acetylglucosamine--dolichyl-phosphate N-acetylglucosaminephosphotransferase
MAIFDLANLLQTADIVIALVVSGLVTALIVPPLMRRMKERGITGADWNKRERTEIPELGGIAILFGFSVGISIAAGVLKEYSSYNATPILAAIGVLFIAGMIGIIDDVSDIPQRWKALLLAFAALPLVIAGSADEIIELPFGVSLVFGNDEVLKLVYWLILVPIAVTGASNALNMSAGYNGLETGQVAIISFALLVVTIMVQGPMESILIFSALMGATIGLNYFNGYPAVVFVGDVGTLAMGAVIAAGAIIGGIELAGAVAIAPAFYELGATAYYSLIKKVNRKTACQRPIIDDKGRLHAPKGAERYTLAFWILSRRPMTERGLVRMITGIYAICGIFAILVSIL